MKRFQNIGHRGAAGHYPENSLLSFQKAVEMGVDGIELDVHLSSDGEIIVIHDATTDRTTTENGNVNELTLQELKSLQLAEAQSIPTLKEVFDLVNNNCFINIELKSFECTDKVVALIEHYVNTKQCNYSQFLVSSFDWNALEHLRNLNENIAIGVLTATNLEIATSFAKLIKATVIIPYFKLLNNQNCKEMKDENLLVYAWTVNEIKDIQQIINFGVDGIISDFPDRVAAKKAF